MRELQKTKFVAVVPPGAIKDNAEFANVEIDAAGWDWLIVIVTLGATDIAMAGLKLQQSDTSGSGFADVTGLICGTSDNTDGDTSDLPSAADDNKIVVFEVDLRGKRRYFDLVATAGNGTNGTYLSAVGILGKGDSVLQTIAGRGCDEILRA
jgi:hypothetical protein